MIMAKTRPVVGVSDLSGIRLHKKVLHPHLDPDGTTLEDYIDIEARECSKFTELEGVGETTADILLNRYDTVDNAARSLLGCPIAYPGELSQDRTDAIRDALEDAGYTPPCACSTWQDVKSSQTRDDCLSHCETCGEAIHR